MNLSDYLAGERGRAAALAAEISAPAASISHWASGERPVPDGRCPGIEQATGGAVPCEDLRPDLTWARIPDKAWPWHKKGRPVLDVAKVAA